MTVCEDYSNLGFKPVGTANVGSLVRILTLKKTLCVRKHYEIIKAQYRTTVFTRNKIITK